MASKFDRLLLAKTETAKGTDAAPTTADAVQVLSAEVKPVTEMIDRNIVKPTMGMAKHAQGKSSMEFVIRAELKGSGTAGVAPETSPLMQACYLTETVDPVAGTVVYKPTTRNAKACTIYLYKDGMLWKGVGCIGTAKINLNIAEAVVAEFTMRCLYTAPVVAAVPANPSFDPTQPLVVSNADVVTVDGVPVRTSSFALDLGNKLAEHYTTSYHEFTVADRTPVFSITQDSVSTAAEWNALKNGDTAVFDVTIGNVPGNILNIHAANAVRESVDYAEREEKDTLNVNYRAYEVTTAGDDQFTITLS